MEWSRRERYGTGIRQEAGAGRKKTTGNRREAEGQEKRRLLPVSFRNGLDENWSPVRFVISNERERPCIFGCVESQDFYASRRDDAFHTIDESEKIFRE